MVGWVVRVPVQPPHRAVFGGDEVAVQDADKDPRDHSLGDIASKACQCGFVSGLGVGTSGDDLSVSAMVTSAPGTLAALSTRVVGWLAANLSSRETRSDLLLDEAREGSDLGADIAAGRKAAQRSIDGSD
jgi:hypothetical protein